LQLPLWLAHFSWRWLIPPLMPANCASTRQQIQYKIEKVPGKLNTLLGSLQLREVSSWVAFIFYSPCWKLFSLVTIFSCSLIVTHSQDESFPARVRVLRVVSIFYIPSLGIHFAWWWVAAI